ncbi:MAG: hypothetical protein AAF714_11685 [Pseudomonadota bacterium]
MLDLSQALQNTYGANRAWSDQYLPEIRRLVGPHLLKPAPEDLDTKQATDLMLLDARDMRLAARVRRPGYTERYAN